MEEQEKSPQMEALNENEDKVIIPREHDKDSENINYKLLSRIISLKTQLPENVYLLNKNGVGVLSVGDIVALTGKAKNGKTQLEKIFAKVLNGGTFGGLQRTKKGLIVLYIDTEQNPVNTQKFAKDTHQMLGWNTTDDNPHFRCLNLRADSPEERIVFVAEAVKTLKPDVVMIDGVKDLLSDINDTTQSAKVLNFLMKLTKDFPICLIAVLHENKNDTNLRGHIGTELTNKASEIWKVKKDGNLFEVTQEISRNAPVDGFSFYLENGTPVEAETAPKVDRTAEAERKMQLNFRYSLLDKNLNEKYLSYSELRDVYSEMSGLTPKTAERHISTAIKRGYIQRGDDGKYSILHLP